MLTRTTTDHFAIINTTAVARVGHGQTYATREDAQSYLEMRGPRWQRDDIIIETVGQAIERGVSEYDLNHAPR